MFRPKGDESCRFHFPHAPSLTTLIARETDNAEFLNLKRLVCQKLNPILKDPDTDISYKDMLHHADVDVETYQNLLSITKKGKAIVLKRKPNEALINHYNLELLTEWRANMDLQFVLCPYSCIVYITSYMMKSEGSMSELLKSISEENKNDDIKTKLGKVGTGFLNNREVSAQEAAFRMLSLPLKKSTRVTVNINTSPIDKRVRLLKPTSVLQEMAGSDTNVFYNSLIDKYAARPDFLENVCLAEFAATFNSKTGGQEDSVEVDDVAEIQVFDDGIGESNVEVNTSYPKTIHLKNNLGSMQRRKQRFAIIRFHKEKNLNEERYRILLMLYFPWRNEETDLLLNNSHREKFISHRDHIHANES